MLRRFREAAEESREAVESAPREPKYLLLEARLAQRAGHHAEALAFLKRAIAESPQWSELFYSRGVSYYLLRRYEDARQSLDQALQLEPNSSRALFVYAATLVNQGKYPAAEQYLHRALAVEPSNARFQYHLGALLPDDARRNDSAFRPGHLRPGI